MKKKIALLLTGCMLAISLVGCGGDKTEEVPISEDTTVEVFNEEVEKVDTVSGEVVETEVVEETVEVEIEDVVETKEIEITEDVSEEIIDEIVEKDSDEYIAFMEEFNTVVKDYNNFVEVFNSSELANDQEWVNSMNELTKAFESDIERINNTDAFSTQSIENFRTGFKFTYDLMNGMLDLMEESVTEVESTDKDFQSFTMMYDGDLNVSQIKCKWESDEEWIDLLEGEPLEAGNGIYTNLEAKEETLLIKFIFDNGTEVDDKLTWEQIQSCNEYYEGDCVVNFSTGGIWDV